MRVALVALVAIVLVGCNTARAVQERDDYRAAYTQAAAENDALRAEVAALERTLLDSVPRDCVAHVNAPGEPRLDGQCVPLDELLDAQAQQLATIAELGAVIDEAAARRGMAACTTGAAGLIIGLPLPGLVECMETVFAELLASR